VNLLSKTVIECYSVDAALTRPAQNSGEISGLAAAG